MYRSKNRYIVILYTVDTDVGNFEILLQVVVARPSVINLIADSQCTFRPAGT